jgi:hypothetical protein
MLRLVGVLVLLAGLGLAANVFRSNTERVSSLDQVMKGGASAPSAAARSQIRGMLASSQSVEGKAGGGVASQPVTPAPPAPIRWQRQEVIVNYESAADRPAKVAAAEPPSLARTRPTGPALSDANGRYELARTLQSELRRVGCYDGEIDGSWGAGSKRAMSEFLGRVNAGLPTEEPDYVLVRLVQSQKERVCGRPCPSGQVLGENGRCLRASVLAGKGAGGSKVRLTEPAAKPNANDMALPPTGLDKSLPSGASAGTEPAQAGGSSDEALGGRMSVGVPPGAEEKATAGVPGDPPGQPGATTRRAERRAKGGVGVIGSGSSSGRSASGQSQSKRWTQTIFNQLSMH